MTITINNRTTNFLIKWIKIRYNKYYNIIDIIIFFFLIKKKKKKKKKEILK